MMSVSCIVNNIYDISIISIKSIDSVPLKVELGIQTICISFLFHSA